MFYKILIALYSVLSIASSEIPERRDFLLDKKINPCENLYAHACNEVIKSFTLRPDRQGHSFAFDDSGERILKFKKEYLANLSTINPQSEVEKDLKSFFVACTNKDARKEEELLQTKKYIDELAKISSKEEWIKRQIGKLNSGNPGIFSMELSENTDNPRKSDLLPWIGYAFLPEKSYAENKDLMQDFQELAEYLFEQLELKNSESLAQKVKDYEIGLQKVKLAPADLRDAFSQKNYLTREAFIKKFPTFLNQKALSYIPKQVKLRIINIEVLEYLETVFKTWPVEDLKALELFYELQSRMDQAYPKFYQKRFDLRKKYLGGAAQRRELNEECTRKVEGYFSAEFDYIILPKMFKDFKSDELAKMANIVRKSILVSIEKNRWLSKSAKKEALNKMQSANMRLVAPKTLKDWHLISYQSLNEETYLNNQEKISNAFYKRDFKYLTTLRDLKSWEGVAPLQVNAFYDPTANQFTLLQGILQYPFYDQSQSTIENLAGIGMVVGHELGHGIDDQGSKYNTKGQLKDWMTKKDLAKFQELTAPLVEQFGKAGMNGRLTLGENIGDLVGLRAALDAAKMSMKISTEEYQKFFLSYARSWCEVQTDGAKQLRLKSDPHSMGEARVNELVKHFKEFEEAFSCKPTDALVLPNSSRVHIW
jgi:putative endopeptidase